MIKKIFIVGCGHSGTSLMIRMLGSHSEIHAISGETNIFLDENNEERIDFKIGEFDRDAILLKKKAWVEKTPKHIHKIHKINEIISNASIIAMVRHPNDVACSLRARGYTYKQGLERWIRDNNALVDELKNNNIYIQKLEDLISDPNICARKILNFLNLPYQDLTKYYLEKKDWYANKIINEMPCDCKGNNHEIFRNWQINQPIFKNNHRYMNIGAGERKIFNNFLAEISYINNKLKCNYQKKDYVL